MNERALRLAMRATAQPADEPALLPELRAQARIDGSDDDALLMGYLVAARQWAEAFIGRPILPTPVLGELEKWPEALLLDAPMLAVTEISVGAVPWTGFVTRRAPGGLMKVRPAAGSSWPDVPDDALITITGTAGWPASDVPEPVRLAIVQLAAHWHSAREPVVMGSTVAEVPVTGIDLLRPYRWRLIG